MVAVTTGWGRGPNRGGSGEDDDDDDGDDDDDEDIDSAPPVLRSRTDALPPGWRFVYTAPRLTRSMAGKRIMQQFSVAGGSDVTCVVATVSD